MNKYLPIACAVLLTVAFAASAEAKTVRVKGKVVLGPLPFCLSVGGYDVTPASPAVDSCVQVTGKVNPDGISLCGTVLSPLKVTPAKGCK